MTPVRNLCTLLDSLVEQTSGDTVTVADLLSAVGRRAHGPVFLLLGFLAVGPLTIIPGATWLIALVTVIFAAQVVIGLTHPWMPKRITSFTFKREYLVSSVPKIARYARQVDRLLKPRLIFLTESPFVQMVALASVAAALITFPLGLVPLGPLLPGLTILLFGLALTARDGLMLVLAFVSLGGAGAVFMHVLPRLFG